MPLYDEDGNALTVQQMVASGPSNITFEDYDAADKANPYAVEGNDLSNFKGVSEEYRTYASDVDSPLDWDASVADNSVEKLKALDVDVDSESGSDVDKAAQQEKKSMQESAVKREENEPSSTESSTDDSKPKPSTPFPTQ